MNLPDLSEVEALHTQLTHEIELLQKAREKLGVANPRAADIAAEAEQARRAEGAHQAFSAALARAEAGLPSEIREVLDAHDQSLAWPAYKDGDAAHQLMNSRSVASTGNLRDNLPAAIEFALELVGESWFERSRPDDAELEPPVQDLTLYGALRVLEKPPHYRFAHAIALAKRMQAGQSFDFFTGSLLISELVALAVRARTIRDSLGDLRAKRDALRSSDSTLVAAVIFELCVGSAYALHRHKIAFIEPDPAQPSPDFLVAGQPPQFVECKRKQDLSEYEQLECREFGSLLKRLRDQQQGPSLLLELDMTSDLEALDHNAVVQAAAHGRPTKRAFPWGSLSVAPLGAQTLAGAITPNYLHSALGIDLETPRHDGLICSRRPRRTLALAWKVRGPDAIKKKTRHIGSLVREAIAQIPASGMATIRVCIRENGTGEVADSRFEWVQQALSTIKHNSAVRIPIVYLHRLFPRPLRSGQPDFIENVTAYKASYAADGLETLYPSTVFTVSPCGRAQASVKPR